MKRLGIIIFVVLVFINAITASAQETITSDKSKIKEPTELETKAFTLLQEIVADSSALKLGENRAFIFIYVGSLLWEQDEKAARQYFRSAADEIIQAQSLHKTRLIGNRTAYYWIIIDNQLRRQLAYDLKEKDVQFALEILYLTRSSEMQKSVQFYQQTVKRTGKSPVLETFKEEEKSNLEYASYDIELERILKKEIDKNDPLKLAANIRESFKNEQNFPNILPDIDELNKKDHDSAQKVLDEFAGKLNDDENFFPSLKVYLTYLLYNKFQTEKSRQNSSSVNNKNGSLIIDEKKLQATANREFNKLLANPLSDNNYKLVENALYLKKILPQRYIEIKPKLEKANAWRDWREDEETTVQLGSEPTLDQIIKNSTTLSSQSKSNYYQTAVNKLLTMENGEKIRQLLAAIPDEADRVKALDYLQTKSSEQQFDKNDFESAEQSLMQIKDDQEKIDRTVKLALAYYQKKTDESRKSAEDLLDKTVKLVNQNPETETEFTRILPIIRGYAVVAPSKAFTMILPLLDKVNELTNASILLQNYHNQTYPNVSENEILFGGQDGYSTISSNYLDVTKKLAAADLTRTLTLANSFSRADVRLIIKLIITQSILQK